MTSNRSVLGGIFLSVFAGVTFLTALTGIWFYRDAQEERFIDLVNTASILERYYDLTFYQWELALLSVGERILEIEGEQKERRRLEFARDGHF